MIPPSYATERDAAIIPAPPTPCCTYRSSNSFCDTAAWGRLSVREPDLSPATPCLLLWTRSATLLAELNDPLTSPGKIRHDEADAREPFSLMSSDLGHDTAGLIPTAPLTQRIAIARYRLFREAPHWTFQQGLDWPLRHGVTLQLNRILVVLTFEERVQLRNGERRLTAQVPANVQVATCRPLAVTSLSTPAVFSCRALDRGSSCPPYTSGARPRGWPGPLSINGIPGARRRPASLDRLRTTASQKGLWIGTCRPASQAISSADKASS